MIRLVVNNNQFGRMEYSKVVDFFDKNGFSFDEIIITKDRCPQNLLLNGKDNFTVYFMFDAAIDEDNSYFIKLNSINCDLSNALSIIQNKYGELYDKIIFKLFGADSHTINYTLEKVQEQCKKNDVKIFIKGQYDDISLQLVYNSKTPKMAIDNISRTIARDLDKYIYSNDDISLGQTLGQLCKLRGKKISTAESFTGGRVASEIIKNSGASSYFIEGISSYSNLSKEYRLGVDRNVLYNYGAVSAECCTQMVEGLLADDKCDVAIATTGIAGPKSDNTNKPVGLCYIGVGMVDRIDVYKYNFNGDRETITQTAVNAALFNAVRRLKYM